MGSRMNQPPVDTSHRHWQEAIMDPETRETWTPEQKVEFISTIINNETFITELTEIEQFITNVFESNTFITQIKGQPNGVPELNGNGKVPKGQIDPDFIENPMTTAGDLIYGSSGTPDGFADLLAGLSGAGAGQTVLSTSSGAGGWPAGATDGVLNTRANFGVWGDGAWLKADFGSAKRVGRFRYIGEGWDNDGPTTDLFLESSDDNSNWVTRWQMSIDGPAWSTVLNTGSGWTFPATHGYRDTGVIVLPQSLLARYWRIRGAGPGGGNPWGVGHVQIDEVTLAEGTEGVASRLAGPAQRRVLEFDPTIGAPQWAAPSAANADTSGATLGQLETEVNELKAILRAHGLLAS